MQQLRGKSTSMLAALKAAGAAPKNAAAEPAPRRALPNIANLALDPALRCSLPAYGLHTHTHTHTTQFACHVATALYFY